jgi:hypothetical protein
MSSLEQLAARDSAAIIVLPGDRLPFKGEN